MKAVKLTAAVVVLFMAPYVPITSSRSLAETPNDSIDRHLRHESAQIDSKLKEVEGKHDSNTPLQRRDQTLVAAHRVYDPVSGLACSLVGECMSCPITEKDESFCRETGYRQELACPHSKDEALLQTLEEKQTPRYRPCSPADTVRPGVTFVKFEAIMSLLLAISVTLLRREREKHMSSFDLRKDSRQRVGLLNSSASGVKDSD
ncbi:RxLR-like protein [Plasmopara halstedii]|uniref:Secreted RxLR effector protein RXLR-C28 n=1 Tax=Plasmopara halstedii TaxID=4781 RepID=RLR28_PLAHL|nr:RxLR-like protein [Plasmopara halstedii]A0A0N7L4N2.1 RecName: Full=Secreted RxLR effector protein RXLR-C28; Flags: Precursor [Plasmopara halstedii]CEG39147.1 RxLR-like protein [Plasmopara halstedii]|eukprot:XP_024575516.1 RxLR-like protein [Plasmopara halstedii]